MATYKVIQDIEAEDKFVGPLTLKQFIFAMGGMFCGYLSFFAASRGLYPLLIVFLPPTLLGVFLAIPWSKDQPTELWVLAKLRFHFKSKKRIWDQSGMQDLVTITAPKAVDRHLTKDFTQDEVKSRLKALAETIDSRGWAVKNAGLPEGVHGYRATSDRLISAASLPQVVPDVDSTGLPDILDEEKGAISANLNHLIDEKDQQHRAEIIDKMDRIRHGEPLEGASSATKKAGIAPQDASLPPLKEHQPSLDDQLLSKQLMAKKTAIKEAEARMHRVQSEQAKASTPELQTTPQENTGKTNDLEKAQAAMTTSVSTDIIEAAQNNDLDVATIGRQFKKNDSNEVVISLH